MFYLRRYCYKKVAELSHRRLASSRETVAESGCKNVDTNSEISRSKPECRYNEYDSDCSEKLSYPRKSGNIKVGIIGGGMAPIYTALLLKQSKLIKNINIADPRDTLAGAVFDLDHIDTSSRIKYYGKKSIQEALANLDIVALMDETDFDMGKAGPLAQFLVTSCYVHEISEYMVQYCPSALVAVFARPVTATMPMVSEVYKCTEHWDPNRIVGSTAIDAMRIEAMTGSLFDLNPAYLSVPVVGGADPCTVVPLLSRARPVNHFSLDHENTLIHQLRAADKELACSSTTRFNGPSLSSGVAAAKFIVALASGLSGQPNIISSAYVRSDVLPVCRFFATELQFGPGGIQANLGLPKVSPRAVDLIEQAIPHITEISEMAINIVRNKRTASIKV